MDSQTIFQRMMGISKIEGHLRCINTISWNTSGSHLLAGSDDKNLSITSTGNYTNLNSVVIQTQHKVPIFAAAFMPDSDSNMTISGDANGVITLSLIHI